MKLVLDQLTDLISLISLAAPLCGLILGCPTCHEGSIVCSPCLKFKFIVKHFANIRYKKMFISYWKSRNFLTLLVQDVHFNSFLEDIYYAAIFLNPLHLNLNF